MSRTRKEKSAKPCTVEVRYDKAFEALNEGGKMPDEDKLRILETAWLELRDAIDAVKTRINAKKVEPLIGNCYRYINRHRETRKIQQTDYYRVLRADGYQTVFFHFSIAKNGGITIMPEHYAGAYVCQHYEKVTRKHLQRAFAAVLDDLKYHQVRGGGV